MARIARMALRATLLIAVVAVAACGGASEESNRYITKLTAAQERFQRAATKLGAEPTTSSTPRQDRQTLSRYADAIADTIVALRAIDVPSEVVAEHRRLIAAFTTWHRDIQRFIAAIEQPTSSGLARARRRIAAATVTFNESARQAGIDIDAKLGT